MMMKALFKFIVILIILQFLANTSFGQDSIHSNIFFSLNYRTGKNTPHRPEVGALKYPYDGGEFKLGWQTNGTRYWQKAFRYPSFGVGINWNTFQTDILGNPFASYFFTSFPQFRLGPLRFDIEVDLGASYGIHPYDEITNPGNMATGSIVNAFFGFYFEQSLFSKQHVQVFCSEGFTHYSNAALGYPNLGLNIPSLKFGVRYQPKITKFQSLKKPGNTKGWILSTLVNSGLKKLDAPKPIYFEVSVSPTLWRRSGYKHQYGLGVDVAYNNTRQVRTMFHGRELAFHEFISYAVFLSHEFLIEDFTILTQFGIYAKNQPTDKFYYERVGFGYYFLPNMRLSLNLKAHYFKAEYLELGLCYDIPNLFHR